MRQHIGTNNFLNAVLLDEKIDLPDCDEVLREQTHEDVLNVDMF